MKIINPYEDSWGCTAPPSLSLFILCYIDVFVIIYVTSLRGMATLHGIKLNLYKEAVSALGNEVPAGGRTTGVLSIRFEETRWN